MKTLFLDFDGVLNDREWLSVDRSGDDQLSPRHIEHVNTIVRASGCRVVVSSAWRHGRSVTSLAGALTRRGAIFRVYSKVRDDRVLLTTAQILAGAAVGETRGQQIRDWLTMRGHGGPIAILDDLGPEEFGTLAPRLVQTTYETGITDEHADAAIALLRERHR